MEDSVYYWSKNCGPVSSENKGRNKTAEQYLSHLNTISAIVKTYHVYSGDNQLTRRYHHKMDRTLMRQDVRPFVLYSMNKKRNWEIEDMLGVELMELLQDLHRDEDVMILERVAMYVWRWNNCFYRPFHWNEFRIQKTHVFDNSVFGRPAYKKTCVDSVLGQKLEHFEEHNRVSDKEDQEIIRKRKMEKKEKEKKTVVAYHLIKPPQNYSTLLQKYYVRKWIHPGRWSNASYWERMRNKSNIYLSVRYDDLEEGEVEDSEGEEDVGVEYKQEERNKCYNLENHWVEHFVHVMRSKR